MAARAAGASPSGAPTIEALIEALDSEVRAAIDDTDRTLIALSLQQSPWGSTEVGIPDGADARQDP